VVAGDCSEIVTLQTQELDGTPAASAVSVSVAPQVPGSALAFFKAPNCGDRLVDGLAIPAGSHTASFYFRGSVAGSHTITVSVPGLAAAMQTQTVTFGRPAQLVFGVQPSKPCWRRVALSS